MNTLSPAEIIDLLGHRYRRYVLYCLYRYANPLSLPTLAHQVTELEVEASADERRKERLHIYMDLHHEHLPALDEANVVEYVPGEELVELGQRGEAIKPHIATYAATETDRIRRLG